MKNCKPKKLNFKNSILCLTYYSDDDIKEIKHINDSSEKIHMLLKVNGAFCLLKCASGSKKTAVSFPYFKNF